MIIINKYNNSIHLKNDQFYYDIQFLCTFFIDYQLENTTLYKYGGIKWVIVE